MDGSGRAVFETPRTVADSTRLGVAAKIEVVADESVEESSRQASLSLRTERRRPSR